MNSKWDRFKDELKIIPPFVVVLAAVVFACLQVVFVVLPKGPHGLPPLPWWPMLGLVAGIFAAAWLLIIGYINADAGRRGMGRILWTFIAILVPNCLGILLYFLLRKPLLRPCVRCGTQVDPTFQFCQKCGLAMSPTCEHCGRGISHEFVCCPYCGKALRAETAGPVGA